MNTKEIREELENIEWYNPVVPLDYKHYHKIIRDLCDKLDEKTNQFDSNLSAKWVSAEPAPLRRFEK